MNIGITRNCNSEQPVESDTASGASPQGMEAVAQRWKTPMPKVEAWVLQCGDRIQTRPLREEWTENA